MNTVYTGVHISPTSYNNFRQVNYLPEGQRSTNTSIYYLSETEEAYLVLLIKPTHARGHLVHDSDLGSQLVLDQVSRQMATHKPDTYATDTVSIQDSITTALTLTLTFEVNAQRLILKSGNLAHVSQIIV